MTANTLPPTTPNFDLVRLTKSKREVDLSANTIRSYAEHGLQLHRVGRAVFFSRTQLANLITSGVLATAMKNAAKAKGRV